MELKHPKITLKGGSILSKQFRIFSCFDRVKEIKDRDTLYPLTLYHTTTDIDSVCKYGLKPSKELKGKKGLGSGGREGEKISFTTDLDIARLIQKDITRLVKIAKGMITWSNFQKIIDEDFGIKSKEIHEMIKEVRLKEIGWARGEDVWSNYLEGYMLHTPLSFGSMELLLSLEEWEQRAKSHYGNYDVEGLKIAEGFLKYWEERVKNNPSDKRIGEMVAFKEEEGIKRYGLMYIKVPKKVIDDLFSFYTIDYLYLRYKHAGITNPIFWCVHSRHFENIDLPNIGIVRVRGYLPHPFEDLKNIWLRDHEEDYTVTEEELSKLRGKHHEICDQVGLFEVRLSSDFFDNLEVINDDGSQVS